ncbi:MAG: hypothetical protein ACPGEF_06055 [Endozoicomonas sp.]
MSDSTAKTSVKPLTQAREVTELLMQDIVSGQLEEGSRISELELSLD